MGVYEVVTSCYSQAVEKFSQGNDFWKMGVYEVATSCYSQAVEKFSQGNDFWKMGVYEVATSCYSQAVEKLCEMFPPTAAGATQHAYNPDALDDQGRLLMSRLFSNRSNCFYKLSRFEEAASDAEETIMLDRGFVKGYLR